MWTFLLLPNSVYDLVREQGFKYDILYYYPDFYMTLLDYRDSYMTFCNFANNFHLPFTITVIAYMTLYD